MTDDQQHGRHAAGDGAVSREPSARNDVEVVRHAERLRLSTERVPLERVRIERHIVTEQQSFTVDVRREEIRVVREPLDGSRSAASDAGSDPAWPSASGSEFVITLNREEILVSRRIVPSELVRVRKTVLVEQQQVVEQLRHEEIELQRESAADAKPVEAVSDPRADPTIGSG